MTDFSDYNEYSWEFAAWKQIREHDMDVSTRQQEMTFESQYDSQKWSAMARKAWMELREFRPDWGINDQVSLLARKQHDYGPKNVLKFGSQGILVRLWDKISRYNELVRREALGGPNFEPLSETLEDIIGYVILYYMVQMGQFSFPLQADMEES